MVYKYQDNSWFNSKERVLDDILVIDFMIFFIFNVIDYKFKKMVIGRYVGFLMGLFLFEDFTNLDYVVCVYIYF